MNKEKLGQEPAFSNSETYNPNNMEANGMFSPGMSKRFYAACAAMQGLLANPEIIKAMAQSIKTSDKDLAKASYAAADELLKQENE
jgi:hypothetical protein